MSNFTQGKWFVENEYDVFSDNGKEIFIGSLIENGAETAANARLIANAPLMFDWLKCILESPDVFASMPDLQFNLEELLERIDGSEA